MRNVPVIPMHRTQHEKWEVESLLGLVGGNFSFKKPLDKSIAVCELCEKEYAHHRGTSGLRCHLTAKHVAANTDNVPSWSR